MENLEEKISEFIGEGQGEINQPEPEQDTEQETLQEVTDIEEEKEEPVYDIEGQKFTANQLKELLQKAKNYDYLLPEFTRKSQELAELKRKIENSPSTTPESEEEVKKSVLQYFKEQLGFLTKEDFEGFMNQFVQTLQNYVLENQRLNEAISYLSQKYDGKFYPKFDYNQLRDFLFKKYGEDKSQWPQTIDLELEYWDMNRNFFEKLPEFKKTAVPTEKGIPSPGVPVSKKVVERPSKEGEISLEEAALDFLKNL